MIGGNTLYEFREETIISSGLEKEKYREIEIIRRAFPTIDLSELTSLTLIQLLELRRTVVPEYIGKKNIIDREKQLINIKYIIEFRVEYGNFNLISYVDKLASLQEAIKLFNLRSIKEYYNDSDYKFSSEQDAIKVINYNEFRIGNIFKGKIGRYTDSEIAGRLIMNIFDLNTKLTRELAYQFLRETRSCDNYDYSRIKIQMLELIKGQELGRLDEDWDYLLSINDKFIQLMRTELDLFKLDNLSKKNEQIEILNKLI